VLRAVVGWVAGVSAVGLVACGAPPPPAEAPKTDAPADAGRRTAGPSIESEVGALDPDKVQAAFLRAKPKVLDCFAKGQERVAYLAGDVHLGVRITRDGGTRWAYVMDSNLGDRETEACMLEVLKGVTWPRPEGGEGLADQVFNFDPASGERTPVPWSSDQLGAPYKKAKGALSQCKKKSGTKGLKATLYVETDGKPAAIGVSSADERGEAAVACVIATLHDLTFPSPGSFASKVSVSID
jgi:hypothetical protein